MSNIIQYPTGTDRYEGREFAVGDVTKVWDGEKWVNKSIGNHELRLQDLESRTNDLRDRSTHTGTQTLSTISDAGSAASKDVGTANGVASLDGSGKVPDSESQVPSGVIKAQLIGQGLSGNYGFFEEGFTYFVGGDIGIDADGNSWIYVGAGAPNKVVPAGTVPSVGAGYEQVTFNAASGIIDIRGSNVQDYIDGNLTPFKTVADMKAAAYLSALPEFTCVEWQGYYTQSDGGSNWGVLRFGAHSEDGGSVFSIDANTYIEANLKGKPISILKFGAKGDGVNDDTSAIQFAIEMAIQNNSSVYIPSGVYKCMDRLSITSGIYMYGDGENSLLDFSGVINTDFAMLHPDTPALLAIYSDDNVNWPDNTKLESFKIKGCITDAQLSELIGDGNLTIPSRGVRNFGSFGAEGVQYINLYSENAEYVSYYMESGINRSFNGGVGGHLEGCKMQGCTSINSFHNAYNYNGNFRLPILSDCFASRAGAHFLESSTSGLTATGNTCEGVRGNIFLVGGRLKPTPQAISFNSAVTIVGNVAELCGFNRDGNPRYFVNASQGVQSLTVTGNTANRLGRGGFVYYNGSQITGNQYSGSSKNVIISSNTFMNCGWNDSTTDCYGFEIVSAIHTRIFGNIVARQDPRANVRQVCRVVGACHDLQIYDNTFYGANQGSTPLDIYDGSSSAGSITHFEIKNGGSGYTTPPTVTLSTGSATAVANVIDGVLVGITVTDPGSGYTTPPTVSFSGGGGSGAEAEAYLSEKPIIRDNVVSSGYFKGSDYELITVSGSGSIGTSGTLTLIDLDYSTIPYPFEVLGVGAYTPLAPDASLQVRVYVDGVNQQSKYPCTINTGSNSESITRTTGFSKGDAGGVLSTKVYTENTVDTDLFVSVFIRVLTDSSQSV